MKIDMKQNNLILKVPIYRTVRNRKTNKGTSQDIYYTCTFPKILQQLKGFEGKVYFYVYADDCIKVGLTSAPNDNGYTIKKNNVISIPRKFFNPDNSQYVEFKIDDVGRLSMGLTQ